MGNTSTSTLLAVKSKAVTSGLKANAVTMLPILELGSENDKGQKKSIFGTIPEAYRLKISSFPHNFKTFKYLKYFLSSTFLLSFSLEMSSGL